MDDLKNKAFDKIFNELYKIKDNYGVNKQVEFYDTITNVIKNGFKTKSGPINMEAQKAEWSKKTNLALSFSCSPSSTSIGFILRILLKDFSVATK